MKHMTTGSKIESRVKSAVSGFPGALVRELFAWRPQALSVPDIAAGMPDWDPLSRAAETIRFQSAQLEYWLSPAGVLRTWLQLCLRAAVITAIPVIPLLALTAVLELAVESAVAVQTVSYVLLQTIFSLVLGIFALRALGLIWKAWNKASRKTKEAEAESL